MNFLSLSLSPRGISAPKLAAALGVLLTFVVATNFDTPITFAQDIVVSPGSMTSEQMEKMKEMQARMRRAKNGKPEGKPEEKKSDEKKDDKGDDKKKEDEVKTVKRPTGQAGRLDPGRHKLQPDESGRVQFNYNGHPWANVLQEYADAANLSFDWQELPADELNLTTRRKYRLDEARDLLNRHLLARGFTLVLQGEVLTAVKINKLDPSLVPRVDADDLEDYLPHEFVRVRFDLPLAMDPEKAKDDVKVLLSPNAKATPLLASRRLLVIDAVANLRSVRDLLYSEQMAASAEIKPRVYQIRHRRADYVAQQVMVVLGMDPKGLEAPQEAKMSREQMQMMAAMQAQQRGNNKKAPKVPAKEKPKVYIAVNQRQNSILVNAPLELVPTIERTIKHLDVPHGGPMVADAGPQLFEKYKTVTISPDAVVTALQDMGNLDPMTQLQSDSSSNTIFAYATAADHEIIKMLIKDLDGSGRRPEVIWLPRRLPAEQVAGSIMELIVGPEEEDSGNNMPWFFFGGSSRKKKDNASPTKGFRVLPDVENNRLLLWANDTELVEVNKLIRKLSENADGTIGDTRRVRRFEARGNDATRRLLEELKSTWTGENPLQIEIAPQEEPAEEKKADEPKNEDKVAVRPRASQQIFWLTQDVVRQRGEQADPETRSATPIRISINEQGEIVIASEDTDALNRLQHLMEELAPSEPEFHRFKLRYIYADDVRYNLEAYFKDEIDPEKETIRSWWGRRDVTPEQSPVTLGKRPPLRFIDDLSTNTLIVANASPSQLRIIEELIKFYDTPPVAEEYRKRRTIAIPIKYSRAQDIAKALKEVYRELLSSKDKEFQDKEGNSPIGGSTSPYVFEDATTMAGGQVSPVFVRFEGILSIGVDEISNVLLVSAREEILDDIKQTVEALDRAAKPDTVVHVHEIRGIISPEDLQKTLAEALGQPWPGGKPLKVGASGQTGARQSSQEGEETSRQRSRRSK